MPKTKKSPKTPQAAPPAYHHGDLRNALIQAGLAILAKDGAQALTLREAARRARVSHAAPYRHFASKEALLAAIAEEGFNELTARLQAGAARYPNDPRQIMEAARAYVGFAQDKPDHLRVMFSNLIKDREAYPTLMAAGLMTFEQVVSMIQNSQQAGAVIEGESRHLALAAWASVHGFAMLLIEDQIRFCVPGARTETLVDVLANAFYQGVEKRR